jgi:hypothetical protein
MHLRSDNDVDAQRDAVDAPAALDQAAKPARKRAIAPRPKLTFEKLKVVDGRSERGCRLCPANTMTNNYHDYNVILSLQS